MQYEMRLDPSIDPNRKQEWQKQGRGENGRQERCLPKEMKDGENDCEYRQLRTHAPNRHPCPMQTAQSEPVDREFV